MKDTLENDTYSSIPFPTSANGTSLDLETVRQAIRLLLGLPINSYVVWLILSGAGGTIASEFFYLNLIVSLMLSFLGSVFHFAWIFTKNAIVFFVGVYTLISFFFFSVPLFQVCICVERYVAVLHPVLFLRYKALRYKVACCCAMWPLGPALGLVVLWSQPLCVYIFMGFSVACMAVVSFCCLAVLRALKQPGPGEGQRDREGEGNDLKRRAFRIILVSLVVMSVTIACLIPVACMRLLRLSVTAVDVSSTIAMMSVFVHPLLYMHKAGKLPCLKAL